LSNGFRYLPAGECGLGFRAGFCLGVENTRNVKRNLAGQVMLFVRVQYTDLQHGCKTDNSKVIKTLGTFYNTYQSRYGISDIRTFGATLSMGSLSSISRKGGVGFVISSWYL
jgi:hypothetical protein